MGSGSKELNRRRQWHEEIISRVSITVKQNIEMEVEDKGKAKDSKTCYGFKQAQIEDDSGMEKITRDLAKTTHHHHPKY